LQSRRPTYATTQGLAYNDLADQATADALCNDLRNLEKHANSLGPDFMFKTLYRGSRTLAAGLCRGEKLTVTLCNTAQVFEDALTREPESKLHMVIKPEETQASNRGESTIHLSNTGSGSAGFEDSEYDPHSIATLFGDALEMTVAERSRHGPNGDGYMSDTELFVCSARDDRQVGVAAEFH
jgi:hypothetical protein